MKRPILIIYCLLCGALGFAQKVSNVENVMIQSTSIYTISGQLLQTIEGGQRDAAHLPNGMYILQHRMSDGSTRSEKIANNK